MSLSDWIKETEQKVATLSAKTDSTLSAAAATVV